MPAPILDGSTVSEPQCDDQARHMGVWEELDEQPQQRQRLIHRHGATPVPLRPKVGELLVSQLDAHGQIEEFL